MDTKEFLNIICEQIKYKPVRQEITEELQSHIEEAKQDFMENGQIEEKEAEEKAIEQMGSAVEIGKKLNKIHKPKLDWQLLILLIIMMGYGILVAVLQGGKQATVVGYMVVGIIVGAIVYLFDYRKLKNHSNIIYLIATILMLLPLSPLGTRMNGKYYIEIANLLTFTPSVIAMPLYLIAFVGFVENYDKKHIFKIQYKDIIDFKVNLDFIKILVLGIISLFIMGYIPALVDMAILAFTYFIIVVMKILQIGDLKTKIKRIAIIIGLALFAIIAFFVLTISTYTYRYSTLITSFFPETDPYGAGYVGMLQKEILENAKWIGEADIEIMSSDYYVIRNMSCYTFIYLVRKNWNIASRNYSINNYINVCKTNTKCQKYKRQIWKNADNCSMYSLYNTIICKYTYEP